MHGGGRISSPAHRASYKAADQFCGLEEGVSHYKLLLLVKRLGKEAGFTPRMIQLLDYYAAYTRPEDWAAGTPIVYQSISRTAMDLGVSERQIQKLERRLFEAGAITWNDSGNHKRYGRRDSNTGQLIFAFGVDLSPLAAMRDELETKLQEKKAREKHWLELKRKISTYRSLIRGLLQECREEGTDVASASEQYQRIAVQIRSNLDVGHLEQLVSDHRAVYSKLVASMQGEGHQMHDRPQRASVAPETPKDSPKDEQKFAHNEYTRKRPFNKLNTGIPSRERLGAGALRQAKPNNSARDTGMEHIQLGSVLAAASQDFKDHLPLHDCNWQDVIEAAAKRSRQLGISQRSWAHACHSVGRNAAATCVLITDQASQRPDNPAYQPAAYFRGMINRAGRGELQLHKSIFSLRGRGDGKKDSE